MSGPSRGEDKLPDGGHAVPAPLAAGASIYFLGSIGEESSVCACESTALGEIMKGFFGHTQQVTSARPECFFPRCQVIPCPFSYLGWC